jgi:hypothetical protein
MTDRKRKKEEIFKAALRVLGDMAEHMGADIEDLPLTEEEENFVADLAGEFSDRWRAEEAVTVKEYLDRLPNDRLRQEFMEVVDMDRFLVLMEREKKLRGIQ